MKDAVSCDKPRGAASRLRSGDFRMGKPTGINLSVSSAEFIGGWKPTRGTETSKYPEEKKSTEIPLVAASERGTAQTGSMATCSGVAGCWQGPAREVTKTLHS